jgi:hypothetical protein
MVSAANRRLGMLLFGVFTVLFAAALVGIVVLN